MKNWLVFLQPHVTEMQRIINTRFLSDYVSKKDDVKSGDLAFLIGGNYGLYGWGYFIKVDKRNTNESNNMLVEITLLVCQPNIVSSVEINQTQELSNIYRDHTANLVELRPREFNSLNHLFRSKGVETTEDIPDIQDSIGKFGIKDTTSFLSHLELAIENHNLATVLFLDLDNFKSVNDNNNHTVGDEVIREALGEVKNIIFEKGELFHRSGDEMIVLLPNLNNSESMDIAENIRLGIENMEFSTIGQGVVTTTIGVATYPETCDDWKNLEKQADEIAMKRKKIRKNSVCRN